MSEPADLYYYARNHDRGPGSWCVRGPNGFQMEVPDKMLAFAIGKLLSGHTSAAANMVADWRRYTERPTIPSDSEIDARFERLDKAANLAQFAFDQFSPPDKP